MPSPVALITAPMLAGLLLLAAPAGAVPLAGFDCVTLNQAGDCAIGEVQLAGDLLQGPDGVVTLTLSNTGPEAAVIANVYLETGLVEEISGASGTGVEFVVGGSPPNLPGARKTFDVRHRTRAVPAPPKNGIGPGESATFTLFLAPDADFDLLLADLRIGVHVIAFESGGSESFVTRPVPEPRSVLLLLLGLSAAYAARTRRTHG